MQTFLRPLVFSAVLFFVCGAVLFFVSPKSFTKISARADEQIAFARREEAYRANNLGVALLEQFNHKEAADRFRHALELDPDLKIAQINLAIALFNVPETDAALIEANKAAEIAPDRPQPFYLLGLIARAQNRTDDAISAFKKVLEFDRQDTGANVNLGQIYVQQRKYPEAIAAFRLAVESEPYNATALYNLATALLREGKREEGQQLMARFQSLRQSGAATNIGLNYLEQGRYAEAVVSTGAEPELVEKETPDVVFQNAQIGLLGQKPQLGISNNSFNQVKAKSKYQILQRLAGGATLFDFDNDGDLDLAKLNNSIASIRKISRQESIAKLAGSISLYRNDKGKFTDVTGTSGDLGKIVKRASTAIVAGDFDNDGLQDLFVTDYEGMRLFRNAGKGRFADVSAQAKFPKYPYLSISSAFVDADHDGDLDIFLAGFAELDARAEFNDYIFPREFEGAPNLLLRNNGDGTFLDISDAAKINQSKGNVEKDSLEGRSVAIVPTDYDNRRDVDLLILNYYGKPNLFRNLRDGSFRDVADEVGLSRLDAWTCAAAGDFNKDGFTDFFFGASKDIYSKIDSKSVFAVSDGRGKFVLEDAPRGTENASAAQFVDYDNDGLLDLIANTDRGFVVSRNLGDRWTNADSSGFKIKTDASNALENSRQILSGDIDGDGDVDLLTFAKNGTLHFVGNVGGEANNSKIVRLAGRASNKTGIGAKIDLRAGSLAQKLESYSASPAPAPSDVHFGLGKREKPDAVRVIWTSGIIQAETEFTETKNQIARRPLKIEELDRKPSSCPYLYAWNGERFEFITDFLGGGEMAYSLGNGEVNTPDADEYVRITSDQLKPRNGKYELRVTNELEEVLYLDRFELVAVDHPENTEVYPNEGLGIPKADKFVLYATRNEKAPLKAFDGKGRDILERLRRMDRIFYDNFESEKFRGYAKPHELVLTLDGRRGYNGKTLLLLTGWTDYAFSSDNVAAAQSGLSLQPPKLQVRNRKGEWETVIESIGISVGRPQTVVVDLTGKFLSESREVRILSNMKTLWDKIAVDASEDAFKNLRVSRINPQTADLRERGFSLEVKPDGKEPILVDYDTVLNDGRWKYFSGSFTRLGNVLPLLTEPDDVFVISKTGDEIALTFNASDLPPLAEAMKRTFLLYSVGYSKEMDINSASPDDVSPLPFRGMTKYPYGSDEQFPMTAEKRRIYEEYTTRSVKTIFPRLETALIK
jgi:tetratricopeptide (TPR) repeat protein